jgi:hypothetical protein
MFDPSAPQAASISHDRAKKGTVMLIVLITVAVLVAAGRAAWFAHRLWRAIPRSNADFGLV